MRWDAFCSHVGPDSSTQVLGHWWSLSQSTCRWSGFSRRLAKCGHVFWIRASRLFTLEDMISDIVVCCIWKTSPLKSLIKRMRVETRQEGRALSEYFYRTMPSDSKLKEIQRVENRKAWRLYKVYRNELYEDISTLDLNALEMYLWHGTDAINETAASGFNIAHTNREFNVYGNLAEKLLTVLVWDRIGKIRVRSVYEYKQFSLCMLILHYFACSCILHILTVGTNVSRLLIATVDTLLDHSLWSGQ